MFLKNGIHYDSIVPVDDQSAGSPSIDKVRVKIGCLNVRGVLGKIYEIRDLIRLTKFDIMCLSETFIDCNVADD